MACVCRVFAQAIYKVRGDALSALRHISTGFSRTLIVRDGQMSISDIKSSKRVPKIIKRERTDS